MCIFAAKTYNITLFMEYKTYDLNEFEGENFVQECLDAFDESVAKIEEEYAIKSKSA